MTGIMNTLTPMSDLLPEQRQEAERLFNMGLNCVKNNDFPGAAKYYEEAIRYRHPGAQNNLAYQYQNCKGVKQDLKKAFGLYQDAALHGNVIAMRNLASCLLDGIGTEKDFEQAVSWLMTAAERRDRLACVRLARIYNTPSHRDEAQMLHWHGKAAELGDHSSMLFLGRHYAKKSSSQDLDRARNWLTEVAYSDDVKLRLEAAKELDDVYDIKGDLVHPALDADTAYQIYRDLAAKGNREAMLLTGYCFEVGNVVKADLNMAIMWYEKARDRAVTQLDKERDERRAQWCRQKQQGRQPKPLYQVRPDQEMPEVKENLHTQSRSYRGRCAYRGRIYYYNSGYLCSSDFHGNDIRIISHEEGYDVDDGRISANITGLYLYRNDMEYESGHEYEDGYEHYSLWMKYMDFDGRVIRESQVDVGGGDYESSIAIYDRQIYYTSIITTMQNGASRKVQRLMCMDAGTGRSSVLYDRADSLQIQGADKDHVFFTAKYINEPCDCQDDGWMILDLATGKTECLSSPNCNPEYVIDAPQVYDWDSPEYIKGKQKREIKFLDLDRGIFWADRVEYRGVDSAHLYPVSYLVPSPIWGDRDAAVPDMPIWNMNRYVSGNRRVYFDGTYCYECMNYYQFISWDRYGKSYAWHVSGHGDCEHYAVLGGYLFLDTAFNLDDGEDQYALSVEPSVSLRKSWFKNPLSEELIAAYENRGQAFPAGRPAMEEPTWTTDRFMAKEPQETMSRSAKEEPIQTIERPMAEESKKTVSRPVAEKADESARQAGPAGAGSDLVVEKKIGTTDIKYRICTFGAKFHIGFGVPVTIVINGRTYQCKTHNSAKGRVDGMKKLYEENGIVLGDVLKARYIASDHRILLEKI